MPFSAWLDLRLVRGFLIKNNYILVNLIDILRQYFGYSGTVKEIRNKLNCTSSVLYVKFAYKNEIELKKLINQISNILCKHELTNRKLSTFDLGYSYFSTYPIHYSSRSSAHYYRETSVARRILSKLLYEQELIEYTN